MGSDWGMPRAHPCSRAVRPITFKMSHPPGLLSCACRAGWSLLRAVPDSATENARHPLKLEFQTQLHTYSANGATSRRSEGRRDLRRYSSGLLPAKSPRAAHASTEATALVIESCPLSRPLHRGPPQGERQGGGQEFTRRNQETPTAGPCTEVSGARGAGPLHAGVEGYVGRP